MPAKILVVDDEQDLELLLIQKFRKNIRAQEYEFIFAHNGLAALAKLRANPDIDIILSDINMPEMDGLTLLSELNLTQPLVKTVIVSAYGDMEKIRQAMNKGAYDFLTKPINFQDLETTINKTLEQVRKLKENLRLRQEQETQLRQSEAYARKQAENLKRTLHELQKSQTQLIQSAKMSSLGQMVAGVAHEINNPVNFISGNLIYVSDYVQELLNIINIYQEVCPHPGQELEDLLTEIDLNFLSEDLLKVLSSMKGGADRIRQIVLSLRTFSRLDEAEIKNASINEGIDSTLLLLQHRLNLKNTGSFIKIIQDYEEIPLVECYPGELNQVFMSIINNAIDAIETQVEDREKILFNPEICIQTRFLLPNSVVIEIADNGCGISEEVKKRLFEPFFTTKPIGQGKGLGLSISYQIIVEKHQGAINVESELGKGTKFLIQIPICQTQTCWNHVSFVRNAQPSLVDVEKIPNIKSSSINPFLPTG